MPYFNYDLHAADVATASYWERRAFVNAWWAIGREDERWTPPRYPFLGRALNSRHNAHLARLNAALVHITALYRTGISRSRTDQQEIPLTSILERPLAAAVVAIDPRRRDATAYLGWPRLAADAEALDRLYYHLVEVLGEEGYHRVVGPVGLSPHLDSGALVDAWDAWPPQHTPTNPPYLPELLGRKTNVTQTGRLYRATVPPRAVASTQSGPAQLGALAVDRLAGDLLPLFGAATERSIAGSAPPDAAEAAYLLRAAGSRAFGALAQLDGAPVGFVLLAPDEAGRLRTVRGGRPLWGRAWLALAGGRPTREGRLLFGAVLPAWRGRGVGQQLWAWALAAAATQGWTALTSGPVWSPRAGESAAAFLAARGAAAVQTYRLYEWLF